MMGADILLSNLTMDFELQQGARFLFCSEGAKKEEIRSVGKRQCASAWMYRTSGCIVLLYCTGASRLELYSTGASSDEISGEE